jgi:hypothetical protein
MVSAIVETSVRSRTVPAATAAMPVPCDVAAAAVPQLKVAPDNTQTASNSTADAATKHTRDVRTQSDEDYMSYEHVSTQTNEGYMSYEQLQQQISTLTALLRKHDPKPDTADTTMKTTTKESYGSTTHQRNSLHNTASTDGATPAAPVQQYAGDNDAHRDDNRLRCEHERLLAKGYRVDHSTQQCPRYYSKYGPGDIAILPGYDGYGSLAQQHDCQAAVASM